MKAAILMSKRLLAMISLLGCFVIIMPWLGAQRSEDAARRFPDVEISANGETVVVSHGKASKWHLGTIGDNPLGFVIACVAMVSSGAWLTYLVRRCPACNQYVQPRRFETVRVPDKRRCKHPGCGV